MKKIIANLFIYHIQEEEKRTRETIDNLYECLHEQGFNVLLRSSYPVHYDMDFAGMLSMTKNNKHFDNDLLLHKNVEDSFNPDSNARDFIARHFNNDAYIAISINKRNGYTYQVQFYTCDKNGENDALLFKLLEAVLLKVRRRNSFDVGYITSSTLHGKRYKTHHFGLSHLGAYMTVATNRTDDIFDNIWNIWKNDDE